MNKSEEVKKCQKRKKQKVVNLFGGCCSICGYNKCLDALEFHHLNKYDKKESPAYIIMRWSFERAKEELDKCILLCSNCHREIHAEQFSGFTIDLQSYVKPWIDKQCNYCRKDFITKDDSHKFCSVNCVQFSQRRCERPNKEELTELIKSTSWTQLGRMFGVSDNGVRKWAKQYNLI